MFDAWLDTKTASAPVFAVALANAAASIARLDEALAGHPLQRAFLYRARLDAVRRQATVDGRLIDPWQLAAVLEGLRLRMDGALRIIERGETFEAARHALTLHQWLVEPDFDQEGEVQRAARHLAGFVRDGGTPLLAAAEGMHAWLENNGTRPPIRAALIRFWVRRRVLRTPVPLTVIRPADVPLVGAHVSSQISFACRACACRELSGEGYFSFLATVPPKRP